MTAPWDHPAPCCGRAYWHDGHAWHCGVCEPRPEGHRGDVALGAEGIARLAAAPRGRGGPVAVVLPRPESRHPLVRDVGWTR